MLRARSLLIPLLTAALVVVPTASADARASGGACAKRGSTTIAATTSARIFSTRGGSRIYGCRYRVGRRHLLWQQTSGDLLIDHYGTVEAVAGRFVAISNYFEYEFNVDERIEVFDLRSGRLARTAAWYFDHGAPDWRVLEQVVLRPTGAFAWTNKTRSGREVRAVGSDGAGGGYQGGALLDAGPDIARNSLALARARLYWTRGGEPRSATLR